MKNIAIVGSKPDTWEKCRDLDRRSWEIWRYSRKNFEKEPKATRWFELHHPRNYDRYESHKPGYKQFLHDSRATLFEHFPWQELIDEFGPYFFHYGQAPWLLAHAITLKPKEIMLFGIEPGTEYGEQKKEVQHFMCIANERGIKISAPEDPALNSFHPLYCLEQDWGGQAEMIARLRSKGIEPTTALPKVQKEFASDRKVAHLEELRSTNEARAAARKLKYG